MSYAAVNAMYAQPDAGCCPTPILAALPPKQCCAPAAYAGCGTGARYHLLAVAYGQTTDDVAQQ